MTENQIEQFNRMAVTLNSIAKDFASVKKLNRISPKHTGVPYEKALEVNYTIAKADAAIAVKGVRLIRKSK